MGRKLLPGNTICMIPTFSSCFFLHHPTLGLSCRMPTCKAGSWCHSGVWTFSMKVWCFPAECAPVYLTHVTRTTRISLQQGVTISSMCTVFMTSTSPHGLKMTGKSHVLRFSFKGKVFFDNCTSWLEEGTKRNGFAIYRARAFQLSF